MSINLKVRFGYTIGPETRPSDVLPLADDLERLGFDSVWIPETLFQPTLDPIVALTAVAARTEKLKLGSHLIIPGKNPVQLARQLAHLDALSGGRLLIVGVLGLAPEAEAGAQVMPRNERLAAMNEVVPLLRRLWTGEPVDHDGPRYQLKGATVLPRPAQDPLEIWLAGQAPSALKRVGRLGEGWMPGFITPAEATDMKLRIEEAAAEAGREMDPEHYGINLFYLRGDMPATVRERLASRRPDGDIDALVPQGFEQLRERADEWVDAGFSKFLLRPLVPPADPTAELEELAAEILPLTK